MEQKERAHKDIKKLEKIIEYFKTFAFPKYKEVLDWAGNYYMDSVYFFENKDYFSAFGAANYAYGIIDAILILEGKKDDDL